MNALDLLLNRSSMPRLQAPAPTAEQLETMFRCALRAPDHGQLRPWRFLVIEGEGLNALGEVYAQALILQQPDSSPEQIKRARSMPLRAPMLIAIIAKITDNPKVPALEQIIAAGCAAHGLLLAAQALNVGAFWRSGEMSHNEFVKQQLNMADNEQLIGFMYVGTAAQERRSVSSELDPSEFVSRWPAN